MEAYINPVPPRGVFAIEDTGPMRQPPTSTAPQCDGLAHMRLHAHEFMNKLIYRDARAYTRTFTTTVTATQSTPRKCRPAIRRRRPPPAAARSRRSAVTFHSHCSFQGGLARFLVALGTVGDSVANAAAEGAAAQAWCIKRRDCDGSRAYGVVAASDGSGDGGVRTTADLEITKMDSTHVAEEPFVKRNTTAATLRRYGDPAGRVRW